MILGLAIAALILALTSLSCGVTALIIVVGIKNSTHKLEYVPIDPGLNEPKEESEEDPIRKHIEEEYKKFTDDQI